MSLRLTLRQIRRKPGVLCTACALIVLGSVAAAVGFAALYGVLLVPLPYPEPAELVAIWDHTDDPTPLPRSQALTGDQIRVLRDLDDVFEAVAGYGTWTAKLTAHGGDEIGETDAASVTPEFFSVMGVGPLRGKVFDRSGETLGSAPVAVVSERLQIDLGSTIELDGVAYRVVAVMPASFRFPGRATAVWVPILLPPSREPSATWVSSTSYPGIARLQDGISLETALARASSRLSIDWEVQVAAARLQDQLLGAVRAPMWALQAATAAILVLATLNAGWLLLWRARRESQRYGIAVALGAHPRQAFAPYVVEVAVLAVGAALGAAGIGYLAVDGFSRVAAPYLPRADELSLARGLILVPIATSVIAAIVAAIPGALKVRAVIRAANGHPGSAATKRGYGRRVAMALQTGVVFALCCEAVLLAATLTVLLGSGIGFSNTDLIAIRIKLPPGANQDTEALVASISQIPEDLGARRVPATVSNVVPLTGDDRRGSLRQDPDRKPYSMVGIRLVSSSYPALLGVTPVAGRFFDDSAQSEAEVVVNEVLARQLFGSSGDALGEQIVLGAVWELPSTIVGVLPSFRHWSLLQEPLPEAYVLYTNAAGMDAARSDTFFVLAESRTDAQAAVRNAVAERLPGAEAREAVQFRDLVWASADYRPVVTFGIATLAGIALLLMVAGLYGMAHYESRAREREYAIRAAIGATPRDLVLMVIGRTVPVYVLGVLLGSFLFYLTQTSLASTALPPAYSNAPSPLAVAVTTAAIVAIAMTLATLQSLVRVAATDASQLSRDGA